MKEHQMVLYFSSFDIDPKEIKKINEGNIVLDAYHKMYYSLKTTKKGKANFVSFCRELEDCYKLNIIGMGEYDNKGKTTICVFYRKDIITILSKEIMIIINELGLTTNIVSEISNVIAFEIIKEIAIKRNLDMNLWFQYSSSVFTHFFIIDEDIRKMIIDEYRKNLNKYISNIKCEESIMDRLSVLVNNNKKDLAITIISGIIIETCMRALIVLLSSPHKDGGNIKFTEEHLPKDAYKIIISKKPFSLKDITTITQMTELDTILLLNSLIEANLVKKSDENNYYGTGKLTLPNVLGKTQFPKDEIAEMSVLFTQYNDKIMISNDNFDWKSTDMLSDILDGLKYYSSPK